MFGADEAGRGPVLGSLFIGLVDVPPDAIPDGVQDSKALSREVIESLATTLRTDDRVSTAVVEVEPSEIDAETGNITELTAEAMGEAIDRAATSSEGVVDACHPDEETFASLVEEYVTGTPRPSITAEHGADETHPVVMAASIVAKDAREQHVSALADEYGEVGSGYPSDDVTTKFIEQYLREYGEVPPCVRSSWKTTQEIVTRVVQTDVTDFTE